MSELLAKWLCAFAIIISSFAIWHFTSEEKKSEPITLENKNAPAESRAPASMKNSHTNSQPTKLNPEINYRYVYSLERKLLFESGFPEQKPTAIVYHGEYTFDIYEKNSEGFSAILQQKILEAPVDQKMLQTRVFVEENGERAQIFSSLEKKNDSGIEQLNLQKDMLSLWLFSSREDTVGKYIASVENVSENAQDIQKQKKIKSQYESRIPQILRSEHFIEWSLRKNFPEKIYGEEITQIGEGKFQLSAKNSYSIRLEKVVAIAPIPKAILAQFRNQETLALTLAKKNLADHPEYQNLSFSKISQQLKEIQTMSEKERIAVFSDLVKLLRLDGKFVPELVTLLSDAILKQGSGSEIFKAIIGALATVGTSEMQAAIRSIYNNPNLIDSGKGTILAALTTTQATIDPNTQDFFLRILQTERNRDLANGAAFALGASLQNSSATGTAVEAKAIHLMEATWAKERMNSDLPQKLAILDSIGNSGRIEFFPLLKNEVNSNADLIVRSRAIFSLRFIPSMEAQQILIQNLGSTESILREAAVAALQLAPWNEAYRAPLEHCAQQDPIVKIQKNCRTILDSASSS